MFRYIMGRSNGKAYAPMVRKIADMSNGTYHWIKDLGVKFTSFKPVYPGYPALRLENPDPEGKFARTSGMYIVKALHQDALRHHVVFRMQTPAQSLIYKNGKVTGVIARTPGGGRLTVNARSVVIATGGFNRDPDLQRQYAGPTVGLPDETSHGNTGDGHKMAMAVGADTVFQGGKGTMLSVRADATAGIPKNFLYVDGRGRRFVNEAGFYDDIGKAMVLNDSKRYFRVYDSSEDTAGLEKAAREGRALKASTLEELADRMRIDRKAFRRTVERYNNLPSDVDFGKPDKLLTGVRKAPFYAIHAEPEIVASFGGLKTDENARVLDRNGAPIAGLYAAGEVANGILYDDCYAYTGVSIQSSLSTGRIAGEEAAKGLLR